MSDELPTICVHALKPEDRARPDRCSLCLGVQPKRCRAAEAAYARLTRVDAFVGGSASARARESITRGDR